MKDRTDEWLIRLEWQDKLKESVLECSIAIKCARLVCPWCARRSPFVRGPVGPTYHIISDEFGNRLADCKALAILEAFGFSVTSTKPLSPVAGLANM